MHSKKAFEHSIPCSGWVGEVSLRFEHFADADILKQLRFKFMDLQAGAGNWCTLFFSISVPMQQPRL
ncbi:hypothetical protein NC652_000991 [Populus alba x Populus x berolinensis]|nr:hypothetical protein NC652_000991 [Populus alba x Populus x berolinensis]